MPLTSTGTPFTVVLLAKALLAKLSLLSPWRATAATDANARASAMSTKIYFACNTPNRRWRFYASTSVQVAFDQHMYPSECFTGAWREELAQGWHR